MVRGAALALAPLIALAAPAAADPAPADPNVVQPIAATQPGATAEAAVPAADGAVVSSPAQTMTSPDGWTLTITAQEETQTPIAPLTTAI